MIYFDNAATTLPKPPTVAQAMVHALETFGGASRGGHPAALAASRCVFQTRKALADLFGTSPECISLTSNATESLNIAIQGLFSKHDHVITTALEHNSVLRPLYLLQSKGMDLSIIDIDGDGHLDYDAFRHALRPNTKAIVCTHASNVLGCVTDLAWMCAFCQEHGLLLIVDAAQTAGVFPIDVKTLPIDVLCFTGHKGLLGPQGTGGLYVRAGLSIPPLKVGGSGLHSYEKMHPPTMPDALEAGTMNAHGLAGLLAGVRYICATGLDAIRTREQDLANQFYQGIQSLPNVRYYGHTNVERAPIVSLNIGALDSGEVSDHLADQYAICTRSGAHCAPLVHQSLGTEKQGAVRFSFSSFNTEEEIQFAIQAIAECAKKDRG